MAKKTIIAMGVMLIMAFTLAGCGNRAGKFYFLQEAYDAGYITREDLLDIAYYADLGNIRDEDMEPIEHTPRPKTPEVLDEKTEKQILKTKGYYIVGRDRDGAKVKKRRIRKMIMLYLGTYNDYVAAFIQDTDGGGLCGGYSYVVSGISFSRSDYGDVVIWKKNK